MRGAALRRTIVAVGAFEAVISTTLLLIASTRTELPVWGGPVDGVLAFAVVGTAVLIWSMAPRSKSADALAIGHAAAATVPALAIAAVWWFREQLDLNVLLPGLAWRAFIVLYTLPSAINAWRRTD